MNKASASITLCGTAAAVPLRRARRVIGAVLSAAGISVLLSMVGCASSASQPAATGPTPPAAGTTGEAGSPTSSASAAPAASTPGTPGTPAPAQAGDVVFASDDDYIARSTVALDKMTALFKRAGTDCNKLADELNKFIDEQLTLVKAATAYEASHPEAKQKFDNSTKDKMTDLASVAGPGFRACQGDKKVVEAMTRMGE